MKQDHWWYDSRLRKLTPRGRLAISISHFGFVLTLLLKTLIVSLREAPANWLLLILVEVLTVLAVYSGELAIVLLQRVRNDESRS